MASRVLVVDDDPVHSRLLEEIVRAAGHQPEVAHGGAEALARLARPGAPPIAAMILDLVMPETDGMSVLARLRPNHAGLPVIVQCTPAGIDAATSAMRAGAVDFLVKPATLERVQVSLDNALRARSLEREIGRVKRAMSGTLKLGDLILRSAGMEAAAGLATRAARCNIPVLIEGETGTGKGLVARAIHGTGARRTRPFLDVDCGLAASSGEITDARGWLRALIADAKGGTLYFRDIGLLAPDRQAALYDFLTREEPKSGHSRRTMPRFIAATDRRLVQFVEAGRFREDLFYRLNVLPIWLPPLRERREDIGPLARHLLAHLGAEARRRDVANLTPEAVDLLAGHHWPGNVGELETVLYRALMLAEGRELTEADFPQLCRKGSERSAAISRADTVETPEVRRGRPVADRRQAQGERASPPGPFADRAAAPRYGVARLLDERGEIRRFEALEEEALRFALDHYRGQLSEVARRLGIGRSTLYRKLRQYSIVTPQLRTEDGQEATA
jgi:DNA-binding NtrC family response regulator